MEGQGSDGENGKKWDPWNGGVILSMLVGSSWTEVAWSTVGDTVVVAENYWKVSNNGVTTWRPTVKEVTFYSDTDCTKQLLPYTAGGALPNPICSGHNRAHRNTGCQLAVDGDITTSWRPQAHICGSGECWIGVGMDGGLPVKCARQWVWDQMEGMERHGIH